MMVSIIIPVLNEEKTIKSTLESLKQLSGEKEIIVVDGGSSDRTREMAKNDALVVQSEKGRAKQMNAGARIARGDILWFVHSDSKLEKNSILAIEKAVEEGHIGGCLNLFFYDWNTSFMRFLAITSNWRAKYLKLIFGDQGMFMTRDIFHQLGGFKNMELMEDWEMSRRIHKLGKMKCLPEKIGTSARRFQKNGPLLTLLRMHQIKLLYLIGVPTEKIARKYRQVR